MSDTNLQAALEPIARKAFQDFRLRSLKVTSTVDHDGDPVVKVDIDLDSPRKYNPEIVSRLTRDLLVKLREMDDTRFPLVWVHYPSDEPQENFYPDVKTKRARK